MIIKLSALGAIGDGRTVNTKTIQKAIDDCAGTGGRVIIDDGLTIKSIVLETIKADERKKIYIEECKNNE